MSIITLTTDFGTRDHYAAVMKGVILQLAPKANVIDITHDIRPYDILHGAFLLRQIWPWYPAGTIHVAVVDPGVGSERRILLGQYDGRYVLAPDNGLITFLHRELTVEAMHVVENRNYFLPNPSNTFQGRDVFAPVAAHLASGVRPRQFGPVTDRAEILPVPHRPTLTSQGLSVSVLYVDRFGTLVTNATRAALAGLARNLHEIEIVVNDTSIGAIRSAFDDVPPDSPVALIGSSDRLEVAINRGSAEQRFGSADTVRILAR